MDGLLGSREANLPCLGQRELAEGLVQRQHDAVGAESQGAGHASTGKVWEPEGTLALEGQHAPSVGGL